MKPSWDDAPSWAQWLAMDDSSEWWWFELEPYFDEQKREWFEDSDDGRIAIADRFSGSNTLERRP